MADVAVEIPSIRDRGPPKKRRRVVISCTECHRRKQKCDRSLPCSNCRLRNKESACVYETEAPTAREEREKQKAMAERRRSGSAQRNGVNGNGTRTDDSLSSLAATWGYAQTGTTTMGFLKRIESAATGEDGDEDGPGLMFDRRNCRPDVSVLIKEKYKGLIRQLPAKGYIDQLIDIYMAEFNWQYNMIDEHVFRRQLDEWNQLPFSVLSSQGPSALSPDLRVFPAVLFQIIGTALLTLPEEPHPVFDAIKYAGNMTFEDLAIDYSDSGTAIVNLFGKQHLSLTTIECHFLRAAFLKYVAKVTESWHVIGTAVRDAQEMGMHRDSLDPTPRDDSTETILENSWIIQRRRKMYLVLVLWDINMAMVLGRPSVTDVKHGLPSLPVDALPPYDETKTPVRARTPHEPPTAITRTLWSWKLAECLIAVQDLEGDGQYPKDFSKVDALHQRMIALEDAKPAVLRVRNPDTSWDSLPELHWLPTARYLLEQLHAFNLMALHRPYVFHRKASRTEALKASIDMLESQRQTFRELPPESWRNFLLFYGSFDAVVLIASVFILFPHEHPELKDKSLQQFQWTIERFSGMQDRNALARAAQGVLKAIVNKVHRILDNSASSTPATVANSNTPLSRNVNSVTPGSSLGKVDDTPSAASMPIASQSSGTGSSYPPPSASTDWTMPPTDSFMSLAPMFPTSDLIFNDLTAIHEGNDQWATGAQGNGMGGGAGTDGMGGTAADMGDAGGELDPSGMGWQFGGAFGEDTLWQFLNSHQLGTAP